MWEIKVETENKFDCYVAALVSFANFKKTEPLITHLSTWCYRFNSSVDAQINKRSQNIIEKYYGIYVYRKPLKDINSLFKYIFSVLEISPVIINVDDFDCPWSTGYKKYHLYRCLLVIGANKEGLNCIDFKYRNKNGVFLPFLELQNWKGFAESLYSKGNNQPIEKNDYQNEIIETISCNRKQQMIHKIQELKQYINANNFIENNLNKFSMDFQDTHILIHIKRFENDRFCFCYGLQCFQHIYGQSHELLKLHTCINESAKLANILNRIIMKQIMKNKSNVESISDCINQIIELEKTAMSIF